MTTSGSVDFNATRNEIIRGALRKIGAIASGETPDAQTISDCAFALNAMVKHWDTKGIHVWTESEGILFLQPGQVQYELGTGTTDHAAYALDNVNTTLTANAAAGDTTLNVVSTSGISGGDIVGIVLDSGTVQWTTTPGGGTTTTIVIADPLTGSASSGNNIYTYTTDLIRPLRVPFGRRFYFLSSIDTPMITMSRKDYRDLPNKTATGIITQFFYDPRGGANTQGLVYVWPAPVDANSALKFTWYRPIQDFDSAANTPDLPQEWIQTLMFNLAVIMAPEYDCPPQRFQMLVNMAASCLDDVTGWDRETESTYFGVNFDQR